MICRLSRPFLNGEERDRRDELAAELHERLTADVEAADRAEYENEFGPTYRALHPYKANSARIEERVCKMIRERREEW